MKSASMKIHLWYQTMQKQEVQADQNSATPNSPESFFLMVFSVTTTRIHVGLGFHFFSEWGPGILFSSKPDVPSPKGTTLGLAISRCTH